MNAKDESGVIGQARRVCFARMLCRPTYGFGILTSIRSFGEPSRMKLESSQ
jgi:hypothetical protein